MFASDPPYPPITRCRLAGSTRHLDAISYCSLIPFYMAGSLITPTPRPHYVPTHTSRHLATYVEACSDDERPKPNPCHKSHQTAPMNANFVVWGNGVVGWVGSVGVWVCGWVMWSGGLKPRRPRPKGKLKMKVKAPAGVVFGFPSPRP